jgi:exopolyphosphatase/guanosine-5'-triphosphate,3'-diphosphate pyrophosphatase
LPGLNPVRADIIVAGAALVESLMDAVGLTELAVSERGLREGLIEDDLAVKNPDALAGLSIRERSVLDLVERCRADPVHARTVRRLTQRLFDEGARLRLHKLGPMERELAGHAALLHDVGTFLSYSDHHLHSYYVVRNTDLLGFDESEIEVMAAVARFHRKSTPRRRYPEYAGLDKGSRRTVRVLAAFVRLAESLDRSHGTLVDDVELAPGPDRTIVLRLLSQRSCDLERWGAEAQRTAFRRTFGRDLRIEGVDDIDLAQRSFADASIDYAGTYQDPTS